VVWMSLGQDGSDYGIYGRLFSYSFQTKGFTASEELQANSFIIRTQGFPNVKLSSLDHKFIMTPFFIIEMLVVWQSEDQDGFGFGVYGQHFQINVTSAEQHIRITKTGEEFQVNTFIYGHQTYPSVAFTKNNGFTVVWQSENQNGGGLDIFAQEFDLKELKKIGVENQINVFERGNQKYPCISSAQSGDYVIGWLSASMNEKGISLHANLYKSDKSEIFIKPQGDEMNITDESIPKDTHPSVAFFSINSNFVAVWSNNYTYGQILNSQNQKVGIVFRINMTETSNAVVAVVGKNGNFVIVWEGLYENKKSIYHQLYDINTKPISEMIKIIEGENPSVVGDQDGSFYIVWISINDYNTNVYGQAFDSNGNKKYTKEFLFNSLIKNNQTNATFDLNEDGSIISIWKTVVINDGQRYNMIMGRWLIMFNSSLAFYGDDFIIHNSSNLIENPVVRSRFSGKFIAVWQEMNVDGSGFGIFGQLFSDYFTKVGTPNFQINTYCQLHQVSPSVSINSNGFFIVWSSFLQDSDGYGIFGQFFDLLGHKILEEIQINSLFFGDQVNPDVNIDELGDGIVVWISSDYKFSNSFLKAQRFLILKIIDNSKQMIIGYKDLPSIGKHLIRKTIISNDGNYAYALQDNGVLQIIDLSRFEIINDFDLGVDTSVDLQKYSNFIYIGTYNMMARLIIINVENSTEPIIVNNSTNFSSLHADDNFVNMKIEGNKLFMQFSNEIYIFSLNEPENPTLITVFSPKSSSNFKNLCDFDFFKNHLVFIGSYNNLLIFNIQNNIFLEANITSSELFISIKISKDGKYLFVGVNTGLKIFEISNLTNVVLLKNIYMTAITAIQISDDGRYLSLTGSQTNFLMDIFSVKNPILLKKTSFNGILFSSSFMINNSFILINGELGTNVIKFICVDALHLTPRLKRLAQQYIPNFSFWSKLSSDQQFLYCGNKTNYVSVIDVSNPTGSSFPIINDKEYSSKGLFPLCALNGSVVQVYQVVNETKLISKGTFHLTDLDDYIITKDRNYLFLSSREEFTTLSIVDLSNEDRPLLIGKFQLAVNFLSHLSISLDEQMIFMTGSNSRIFMINVTNKSEPKLSFTITGADVSFIYIRTIFEKHHTYIFSTNHQLLFIYEWDKSNNSFKEMSRLLIDSYINAIEIINNDYLAILGDKQLSIVNIHNKYSPVVIDSITLRHSSSFAKLAISSDSHYIYTPSVETIGLYDYDFDLYPAIFYNVINSQKIFQIIMCPINMKTRNSSSTSVKMISVSQNGSNPIWLSIDYKGFTLKLTPNSINDLVNWAQPIVFTIVKQIQIQLLEADEINELQKAGYLDNELFITSKYNSDKGVIISNKNLSEKRLNFILNQNYIERKIYFPIEDFLLLAPFPKKNVDLQQQFDKNQKFSFIKADERIDFQFSSNTFQDPDGTPLSFTATSLPAWLSFDKEARRFYGTPSFEDLGLYTIGLIASNGFHSNNDSFKMEIRYEAPTVNPNCSLQSQLKSNPQVDIEYILVLKSDSFIDANNDSLTYAAYFENLTILPGWITFDNKNLIFDMNPSSNEFLNSYTIVIIASNKFLSAEDRISFSVVASWIFVIKVISWIISPLITVYGLINYRTPLFNLFCKRYYYYKEAEITRVDCYFEKEFYFINDDLRKAKLFWEKIIYENKLTDLQNNIQNEQFNNIMNNILQEIHDKMNENPNFRKIDKKLLQPEGTLFVIIECFLVYSLMKKHKQTQRIYLKIKSDLYKRLGTSWYSELISFDKSSSRNRKFKKFPEVLFNEDKIHDIIITVSREIESKRCSMRKNKHDNFELIRFLIRKHLKADAIGIPQRTNPLELSRGESILIDPIEINEITALKKKVSQTPNRVSELQDKLGMNYYAIELINNNRKLPKWLDCMIEYGILRFYGTPEEYDLGEEFHVKILHVSGMIVRLFSIKIVAGMDSLKKETTLENVLMGENVEIEIGTKVLMERKIKIEKDSQETLKLEERKTENMMRK